MHLLAPCLAVGIYATAHTTLRLLYGNVVAVDFNVSFLVVPSLLLGIGWISVCLCLRSRDGSAGSDVVNDLLGRFLKLDDGVDKVQLAILVNKHIVTVNVRYGIVVVAIPISASLFFQTKDTNKIVLYLLHRGRTVGSLYIILLQDKTHVSVLLAHAKKTVRTIGE